MRPALFSAQLQQPLHRWPGLPGVAKTRYGSVERVVLKPYYSKKYAVQFLCPSSGSWQDYQPWTEVEEGDDIATFELNRVVETRQMKLWSSAAGCAPGSLGDEFREFRDRVH